MKLIYQVDDKPSFGQTLVFALQQMLADGGSDLRVMDYTLDQRSALTHLYYAGVPSDEIDAFIEKKQGIGKGRRRTGGADRRGCPEPEYRTQ